MTQVRQIFIRIGVITLFMFFSAFNVYAQSAIRLIIPINSPACLNGVDDDGDGLLDYPDDTDCIDQDDPSEHHLTATCSVSATAVTLGQSVIWSVTPLGGSTTYTYSWSGSEIVSNTQNVSVIYSSVGSKTASVTVTSGADSLIVNCADTVTVTSTQSNNDPGSSGSGSGSSGGGSFLIPVSAAPENTPIIEITPTPENIHRVDVPVNNNTEQGFSDILAPLDSAPEDLASIHENTSVYAPVNNPDTSTAQDIVDVPVNSENTMDIVHTGRPVHGVFSFYIFLFLLFLIVLLIERKNILHSFENRS